MMMCHGCTSVDCKPSSAASSFSHACKLTFTSPSWFPPCSTTRCEVAGGIAIKESELGSGATTSVFRLVRFAGVGAYGAWTTKSELSSKIDRMTPCFDMLVPRDRLCGDWAFYYDPSRQGMLGWP